MPADVSKCLWRNVYRSVCCGKFTSIFKEVCIDRAFKIVVNEIYQVYPDVMLAVETTQEHSVYLGTGQHLISIKIDNFKQIIYKCYNSVLLRTCDWIE